MTEATLTVNSPEELLQLFGPRDQHLRKLRQLFDVTITHRGGRIRIAGDEAKVNATMRTLENLRGVYRRQGVIGGEEVETVAAQQCESNASADGDSARPSGGKKTSSKKAVEIRHAGRKVRPRTDGQAEYVDAIREYDLTFATGPAGCGKTYLAVATAVEAFKSGAIRKIVSGAAGGRGR